MWRRRMSSVIAGVSLFSVIMFEIFSVEIAL